MYTNKHNYLSFIALSLLGAMSLGSCADIDSTDAAKGKGDGKVLKIIAKVDKPQTTRVSSNESWIYNSEDSTYTKWQEFQWESGDEIAIVGPDGSVATYRTENGDGTFTAVDGGLHMSDGQLRAVYPASAYTNDYSSIDANNQQCFVGETWVSGDQEEAYIGLNSLLSKVNIRTYTEDGSYPIDIQPILYGISDQGYFDNNSFTMNSGWPDSIKFENSNTFIPQYDYNPLKKKDCKIYTSYESLVVPNSGDYWNNGNSCKLKYSLYGIFDTEKTIPEKLQAGTEYDIMLKVPKEPTIDIAYPYNLVTINMPIPQGFSMDNINRDDYEIEISSIAESWKMSLPETIADSVLSFTVNPKQLYTSFNTGDLYMYSIFINKKNHETGNIDCVYSYGEIGSHAKQMEGEWQGTELWHDWEDETEHTKTYNITFWRQWDEARIEDGPFPRGSTKVWMFGNEVKIVYWRPDDNDHKLYMLSGKVDNPACPTSFQGSFLCADTQTWQVDYNHEFNMKRISN